MQPRKIVLYSEECIKYIDVKVVTILLIERSTLKIVKDRIPLDNSEVPELSEGINSLAYSALPVVVKAFSAPHQMAATRLLLKYVHNATRRQLCERLLCLFQCRWRCLENSMKPSADDVTPMLSYWATFQF